MKSLVICSGGLDSTILYYHLQKNGHEVHALNFDYGSKHNARERAAMIQNIPSHTMIDIDLTFLDSALLKTSDENIPEGHYADPSMKKTVVPFRNGILLSYAVAFAESEGFERVAIANHFGDHAVYPDCRADFMESFRMAAASGTYNNIEIYAPYTNKSKTDIVAKAVEFMSPQFLSKTWSCYVGGEIHCGKCGTCFERKEAFKDAGVVDFTEYVS